MFTLKKSPFYKILLSTDRSSSTKFDISFVGGDGSSLTEMNISLSVDMDLAKLEWCISLGHNLFASGDGFFAFSTYEIGLVQQVLGSFSFV